MAWYPDAIKRDIGRGKYAHTPVRFVLHTAVVNASELKPDATGSFWHFYVGPTGTVYQYVDTAMRAGAETYPGSVGSISVETWDGYRVDAARRPIPLDAYGVTGWRSTSDVPAWTGAQVASLAKLWAWLRKTHPTIPNRLATTSKSDGTSHGLAYHRLGVKLRATDTLSQTGGVVWSSTAGKVCPGARRMAQVPGIHALSSSANPASTTQEDFLMALTDSEQRRLLEAAHRIMGGIPAGSAEDRTSPDGRPARVLDSEDGDYLRLLIERQGAAIAALTETVAQLGTGQGVDPEVIRKAVADAIASIETTVSVRPSGLRDAMGV